MSYYLRGFLTVVLIVTSQAFQSANRVGRRRPGNLGSTSKTYKLCTFDEVSYDKCLQLVRIAEESTIALPLVCAQRESRAHCVRSVAERSTDFLVADGHGYQEARRAGLYPVIFESENRGSLYIAVVRRNITFEDVFSAPIEVDQSNDRAFHAAAFFNLRRGHDICLNIPAESTSASIKIVDSADYTPNDGEILICPDRSYAEANDYGRCNFEAELQRAIFIPRRSPPVLLHSLQRIVRTIFDRFGHDAERVEGLNSEHFNFFTTFNGEDNVIFGNNAVRFDFHPTYQNGVSENVFNLLHCNSDDSLHDPQQLK